jgi:hypothetical protein
MGLASAIAAQAARNNTEYAPNVDYAPACPGQHMPVGMKPHMAGSNATPGASYAWQGYGSMLLQTQQTGL